MHSIRARILFLTAVPTAALAIVAVIASLVLGHLADDLRFEDHKLKVLRAHGTMDMMHDALKGDALRALVATTPVELAEAKAAAEDHAARFKRDFETIRSAPFAGAVRDELATLAPNLEAYTAVVQRVIAAASADRAAATAMLPELDQRFKSLEVANEALGDHLEDIGDNVDDILAQASSGRNQLIVICLIATALAIGGGLLIGRRLASSIKQAGDVLHAVAEGDLRSRVDASDRSEIGTMLRSLNRSLDQMTDMLSAIAPRRATCSTPPPRSTRSRASSATTASAPPTTPPTPRARRRRPAATSRPSPRRPRRSPRPSATSPATRRTPPGSPPRAS
jgi:methyl-accepting chemotaxis protein